MLGELNQILTGEDESYVIELWLVTVLFIWMFAKLWIVDVNKNPELEDVREEKPGAVSDQTRPTYRTGIPGIVPLRCDPERCKSQNSVISQNSSGVVKKKQGEFTPPIPAPYPPSYNHKSNQGVKRRLCELAKSAPRHSNYIQLFLELFSGYKIDINEPLLLNGMTIFHCCCLSVSYKLMVSVIHLADISILTYH
ncbi:uncharacterized protein LOC111703676, partial [Eurytemora carolleeae]|uniref:uncharacterized protein LOC111703676 n=1 Tax=Eurytemora carolleeae TaxID=1294199 RepID=UPI000C78835C